MRPLIHGLDGGLLLTIVGGVAAVCAGVGALVAALMKRAWWAGAGLGIVLLGVIGWWIA